MQRAQCSLPLLDDDQLSQVAWDWKVSWDSGFQVLKPKTVSGKQGQSVTLGESRGYGACLMSSPASTTHQLCNFGQVT